MDRLYTISQKLSIKLANTLLIERTPTEIADAILMQTDGETERAVMLAFSYLHDTSPISHLVRDVSRL